MCKIYLRITKDRKSAFIPTDFFVYPQDWDSDSGKISDVKRTHRKWSVYRKINNYLHDKDNLFYEILVEDIKISLVEMAKRLSDKNRTPTYEEYMSEYIKRYDADRQFAYIDRLQKKMIQYREFLGVSELKFSHFTIMNLERFQAYLMQEGLVGKTINEVFKKLKQVYNHAIRTGTISPKINPFENIHRREESEPIVEVLSIDQIKTIESIKLPPKQDLYRNMFLLGFYTGLRVSDIITLENVHVRGDRIITGMIKKNGKEVYVPLIKNARSIIDKYNSNQKYVFPEMPNIDFVSYKAKSGKIKSITARINAALYKIAAKLDYKRFSFHASRSSIASYLHHLGVNISVIQRILGHSKPSTTERYLSKLDFDPLKKAMKEAFD